jgi:hypothetical protein
LNDRRVDLPASHGQLFSLYRLAEYALERDIKLIIHADQADTLFMGLNGYFRGFPQTTEGYIKAASCLSEEERLDRLVSWDPLGADGMALLKTLGGSAIACREWINARRAEDRAVFSAMVAKVAFPRLQQLAGQVWAGVPYQNCWLPVQRALDGGGELVSPFFDPEMIHLGLSLPTALKFRDGVTKPVLREALARLTGIRTKKVASPSPIRWWNVSPDLGHFLSVDSRLRGLLGRVTVRNVVNMGASYEAVLKVAALGRWISAHGLDGSVAS